MLRIAYCTVHTAVAQAIQQSFVDLPYQLTQIPAYPLTNKIRRQIHQLEPHVVLLEFAHTIEHLNFYYFLRSDGVTRQIPVVFLAIDQLVQSNALALEPDACIVCPPTTEELLQVFAGLALPEHETIFVA
jgi:hypothetical protein